MTVERRRGLRLPRPQRRRQDDDDPHAARPAAPDERLGARSSGSTAAATRVAIHARLGNLPGDFAYDPRLTGRELLDYFAELRGMRRPRPRRTSSPSASRPTSTARSASSRAATGRRSGSSRRPSTIPSCSSSTSRRRGLDPLMQEEFLTFVAEERDRGLHRLPLLARPRRGRARLRPRRDHPRGPAGRGRGRRRRSPARAYRHVTLEFAEPRRPGRVPPPARRDRASSRTGARISFKARGRPRRRRSRPRRATP